jgi:phosphate transport system permease protein
LFWQPIYLSEIAKKRTRNLLRPLIELLAEFHLLFMVFWIGGYRALNSKSFGLPVGETAYGSVVLAIMVLPTIITSQRTQCATHRAMKEASLALGHPIGKRFTRW